MFNFSKPKINSNLLVNQIILTDESFEPAADSSYAMVDLVDFVNSMFHEGHYRRDEVPAEAIWLYSADYFIGQIKQNGHAGFLENSGAEFGVTLDKLPTTFRDIQNGLKLIGATTYEAGFNRLLKWMKKNPKLSGRSLRETPRSNVEDFNTEFFNIDANAEFYELAKIWLQNSEYTTILPNEEAAAEIETLKAANPHYSARNRIKHILFIQNQLDEGYDAYFRYAFSGVNTVEGKPVEVLGLGDGVFRHPKDNHEPVWPVETADRTFIGFLMDDHILIVNPPEDSTYDFQPEHIILNYPISAADKAIDFHRKAQPVAVAAKLLEKSISWNRSQVSSVILTNVRHDKRDRIIACEYAVKTENDNWYFLALTLEQAVLTDFDKQRAVGKLSKRELSEIRNELGSYVNYVPKH